jgi:staphylococcal nuclease domain-containing protein 1
VHEPHTHTHPARPPPGNAGAASDENKNVSEMVVARGFAAVARHRSDEERSRVYETLLELEEGAKAAKRGIHSSKEAPAQRANDVSVPGSAQR